MSFIAIPAGSTTAQTTQGNLVELTDETVTVGTRDGLVKLDRDAVRQIRVHPGLEQTLAPAITIQLTNGDFIKAASLQIQEELARIQLLDHSMAEPVILELGIEYLRDVHFQSEFILSERPAINADQVKLTNGDELAGTLDALIDKTLSLKTKFGPVRINTARVSVLALNPQLAETLPSSEVRCILYDRYGSAFTLRDIRIEANAQAEETLLTGELLQGSLFTLPLLSVQRIDFYNRRFRSLLDFPAIVSRHTTAFGTPFEVIHNRSLKGNLLRAEGQVFRYGFGTSSESILEFEIPPQVSHFAASVAFDPGQVSAGNISVEIAGDQHLLWQQSLKTMPPVSTGNVSLKGTERLQLRVHFAEAADINDSTNWLDPLLIQR